MTTNEFASSISEPLIREFYLLWKAQCIGGLPPFKNDFRLHSLPHEMWPHLFFYDHTDDNKFYCIHNGTAVVRYFGKENTGHYMEDFISPEFAQSVRPLYEGTIENGQGVYYRGDLKFSDEGFYVYSRLLLPIRADTGETRHIVGIMVATGEEKTINRSIETSRRNVVWDNTVVMSNA